MLKFQITKQEYNFVNEVYSHGISGGVTLDTVKKAAKCIRAIDRRFRDVGEAIKIKGKEIKALSEQTEDEKEKAKIIEAFNEEVEVAMKESEWIESTKDAIKALVDILERVDWTKKELMNKFKAADTLMLEDIIEKLQDAKNEDTEEETEEKPKKKK